jgi:hypothetical protein
VVEEVTPVDYCVPVHVSSAAGCIASVSIGGYSRSSSCTGYSFTEAGPVLAAGSSYSVVLTPSNSSSRFFWRIWVDFNSDGDFDDAGEQLVTINNKKGTGTATLVIPAQATGTTRMRITVRANASPSPCDDSFSGEVEDYQVTFGAGAPGMKVFDLQSATDQGEGALVVYPNPTRDQLNIRVNDWNSSCRMVIYNLNGQAILTQMLSSSSTTLDAGSWPKGMYLILVFTQDKILKERVVVE